MSAPTFLQVLAAEVAKFQTMHPARLGELARAHALILHGQVLPSADDPQTGQVLSSDGAKRYRVNGTCDCQAGLRGQGCKHMQAWKLYQYIARKVEAAPDQDYRGNLETPPLPEAPVSMTLRATLHGHEVLVTLRGHDFASVQAQVEQAAQWLTSQAPQQAASQGEGYCALHQVQMRWNEGKGAAPGWYSHRTRELTWCKGK